MFIFVDEKTLEIKVLPEAMKLKELDDLWKSDHTTNKTLWKDWIKYIYFTYKKEGVFSGDLLTQKRMETCYRFFPGKDPSYFEKNPKVVAVAKLFIDKQYTHWEKLLEKWKEDVDAYITYLTEVPYKKLIPGVEGEDPIEVPNLKEKREAQQAIQDLVDTGKRIEQMVLQEKKEGSGKLQPLFDE